MGNRFRFVFPRSAEPAALNPHPVALRRPQSRSKRLQEGLWTSSTTLVFAELSGITCLFLVLLMLAECAKYFGAQKIRMARRIFR
jgi:hypothetical protein